MDISNLNDQVRMLTKARERIEPGALAQGERVAVYAVAIAHHLGFDEGQLLGIRLASELSGIDIPNPVLLAAATVDDYCGELIRLCKKFDQLRSGVGGLRQLSDADAVEWLTEVACTEFHAESVDALLSVQGIIQPIGT